MRKLITVLPLAQALHATAAGGRYAVDDASVVDSGLCQIESWLERSLGESGSLTVVNPDCHAFGLEWSVAVAHARSEGTGLSQLTPQIKLAQATPLSGISLGAAINAVYDDQAQCWTAWQVLLPATWAPRDNLRVHLNVGRDLPRASDASRRTGAAAE